MAFKKNIRIKCVLQMASGMTVPGVTRNLSMEGLFMECYASNNLARGEMVMITLHLEKDQQPVSIKSRCRIENIFPDGVEISAQFAYQAKNEVDLLKSLLVDDEVPGDEKKSGGNKTKN